MSDNIDLMQRRLERLREKRFEEIPRPKALGLEDVIEDAILAMHASSMPIEDISRELLLAGVLVLYQELEDAGKDTNKDFTVEPYDIAIRYLLRLREDYVVDSGLDAENVSTKWPR
jgi:hypothetical protein